MDVHLQWNRSPHATARTKPSVSAPPSGHSWLAHGLMKLRQSFHPSKAVKFRWIVRAVEFYLHLVAQNSDVRSFSPDRNSIVVKTQVRRVQCYPLSCNDHFSVDNCFSADLLLRFHDRHSYDANVFTLTFPILRVHCPGRRRPSTSVGRSRG